MNVTGLFEGRISITVVCVYTISSSFGRALGLGMGILSYVFVCVGAGICGFRFL